MARPDLFLALAAAAALTLAAGPAAAQQAAPASKDPRVKFKDGARYLGDLSDGLEIPRADICKELSRYDCNDQAFRIVLGGVEPYEVRVLEPLEHTSLAAPIAFDRVALHVCQTRVEMDRADPAKAVLFRPAASRGAPSKAWMDQTAQTIYDRVLRRDATPEEKAGLADFYRTVSRGRGRDPAAKVQADWVVLSCFAVASSLEAAFY